MPRTNNGYDNGNNYPDYNIYEQQLGAKLRGLKTLDGVNEKVSSTNLNDLMEEKSSERGRRKLNEGIEKLKRQETAKKTEPVNEEQKSAKKHVKK